MLFKTITDILQNKNIVKIKELKRKAMI